VVGQASGHIAIIASNYWPEPTGTSQTVTEFAEFLARRGIHVRVATAMPYYPQWEIYPAYRGFLYKTEQREGVMIHRAWHWVAPSPSAVGRLLQEASLSFVALPAIFRALRGARCAYVVSPALGYAFTGMAIARALGVPTVLVVKDVMPDAAVETGILRNRGVIAVSRWLARRMYRTAREIHTLGEGMARRLARAGAPTNRIRIVPDTVDARELAPVPRERNEFRRRFVPTGTFAVVHAGNMGTKQDLNLVLRAADRLRCENGVRFFVFGDGAVKGEFLRRREALGLGNVCHFPLQERWLVPHILSGADIVLVSQLAAVLDIVVPSKLVTAMGAGAMIVAACAEDSETARLIRTCGGGLVVPAGDDDALARAILMIRQGAVDVESCRARARESALARFDREAIYGSLAAELDARVEAA
jgi:putative colanic acid biosynthesis glycosyltransferase WcaI